MKRLEAVYLANVMLYVKTIETIIKFIQVNKKCLEASKIIRYYETRKLYENEEDDFFSFNYVVVKNVFELFPNTETIRCKESDIKKNYALFYGVNQIEMDTFSWFSPITIYLPQRIMDKISKLIIISESLCKIQLCQFPCVRAVEIDYSKNGYLKQFLGDENIKLNQLVVRTEDSEELNCLKEYKNIQKKIIRIASNITKERYMQLYEFANVLAKHSLMEEILKK